MILRTVKEELGGNSYPGRGIIIGLSEDGKSTMFAYFIMGRSVNSRNRIFTLTEDGIQTEAFDASKMVDPSLIIYHPVRYYNGYTIVTNGDQTDTIWNGFKNGETFVASLETREFEPDSPNFTPRISAAADGTGAYKISILKSADGDPKCCMRNTFHYSKPKAGVGNLIHTYMGDGSPLPSFEGEPKKVVIRGTVAEYADEVWDALDEDNRVSLYVAAIELGTGRVLDQKIINKNV